eukprot:5909221-Amphidinium_carterae.1
MRVRCVWVWRAGAPHTLGTWCCSEDRENDNASGSTSNSFTTIMVQNLPRVFMQQNLMDAIDAAGVCMQTTHMTHDLS